MIRLDAWWVVRDELYETVDEISQEDGEEDSSPDE